MSKAIGPIPKAPTRDMQMPPHDVARFIAGAPGKDPLPWENPAVRADLRKIFNTRLPERLLLKLEYLLTQPGRQGLPTTKQSFAEMAIERAIDAELEERGIPKDRL
jgi:hypothetical protein